MTPEEGLLAVGALHAGFQAVVTFVTYPALVDVGDREWVAVHTAHSRRIARVVAPLYLLVLLACAWALVAAPSAPALVAAAGHGLALVTTAAVAAPVHGRLGEQGPTPALLSRLVLADRIRLLGALVGLGSAALL